MVVVSTPLLEEARSIFTELGYAVSMDGTELRAERKWRVVYVTAAAPDDVPERGKLRCFVTREERAPELRSELLEYAPDYDWAVMALDDTGDYRIHHPTVSEGFPT